MIAMILTAGNGTRIEAIKKCRSKCMLPVDGKPLLSCKLEQCAESGSIEKFHIVINREETEIQSYFGAEYRGIPIVYHVQGDMSGELVGAIFSVEEEAVYEQPVLLMLGDEYFGEMDIAAMLRTFEKRPKAVLTAVIPTDDPEKIRKNYTVDVSEDGRILKAVEKPQEVFNNLIGTGIVVIPKGILKEFRSVYKAERKRKLQLTDLIESAPEAYAYTCRPDRYCNLNSVEEYAMLNSGRAEALPYERITPAFRATARAHPGRIAVVEGSRQMTYRELDDWSDRLCESLRRTGCEPGNGIGIMCSRTIEHMAVMLAVLKAGCHYIPLDENHPVQRIQYMLSKASAACIVASRAVLKDASVFHIPVLFLEELDNGLSAGAKSILWEKGEKGGARCEYAYILFTSGSTGNPKGAVITQRSVINLVMRMEEEAFGLLKDERLQIGVTSSFAFDLSVQQIYVSLLRGHTLHIIPHEAKMRSGMLTDVLDGLDACDGTPLMMHMINRFLDTHPGRRLRLRMYLSAGEQLKKEVVHTFFTHCPDILVVNCYGPTECTVETTLFPMDREREAALPEIPIGKPMKNTQVYVLDEDRRIVCPGEAGEIWIAGLGVGEGYVGDEHLTELAFFKDILNPGQRMYRTGDLGYWGKDGSLYYCGRIDDQVKFKGYRIEPGEIERAVEGVDGIELCKVLLLENTAPSGSDRRLAAYFAARQGEEISAETLREQLLQRLPEYMIPQHFIPVAKFHFNHNGKMDLNALLDYAGPAGDAGEQETACVAEEGDRTAELITACIRKRCGCRVLPEVSLRTLGFDSLMGISLLAEIEETFSVRLELSEWTLQNSRNDIVRMVMSAEKQRETASRGRAPVRNNKAPGVRSLPMQQYLIELEQFNQGNSCFSLFNQMVYLIPVSNHLDLKSLGRAFHTLLQEHDAFRMNFIQMGQRIHTRKIQEEECTVRKADMPELTDHIISAQSAAVLGKQELSPLLAVLEDMSRDGNCLARLLYSRGNLGGLLVLSVHHVIFDYLSLIHFMREMDALYRNLRPPRPNSSFTMHIEKHRKAIQSGAFREQSLFWQNKLAEVRPADWGRIVSRFPMLSEHERPQGVHMPVCMDEENQYRQYSRKVDHVLYRKLKQFCLEQETGEFTVLFSLMLTFLYQQEEEPLSALLFYASGRNELKPVDTIGFFSHLLPFPVQTQEDYPDFDQMIKMTEEETAKLRCNENGFLYMEEQSIRDEILSQSAIFDYQQLYCRDNNSIWKKLIPLETARIHNPLSLRVFDYGDGAELSILYHTSRMCQEEIDTFAGEYLKRWGRLCV